MSLTGNVWGHPSHNQRPTVPHDCSVTYLEWAEPSKASICTHGTESVGGSLWSQLTSAKKPWDVPRFPNGFDNELKWVLTCASQNQFNFSLLFAQRGMQRSPTWGTQTELEFAGRRKHSTFNQLSGWMNSFRKRPKKQDHSEKGVTRRRHVILWKREG